MHQWVVFGFANREGPFHHPKVTASKNKLFGVSKPYLLVEPVILSGQIARLFNPEASAILQGGAL